MRDDLDLDGLLERVSHLVRHRIRESAHAAGLDPVQLATLRFLVRCNRYSNTPGAVAAYLGHTRGTTSQTIRALVQKGLVVKRRDPKDRRIQRCSATLDGRRVVARVFGSGADGLAPGEGAVDLVGLEHQLRSLVAAMEAARGSETFGNCRSCRHFLRYRRQDGETRYRCAVTAERLELAETLRLCRLHEGRPVEGRGPKGRPLGAPAPSP